MTGKVKPKHPHDCTNYDSCLDCPEAADCGEFNREADEPNQTGADE